MIRWRSSSGSVWKKPQLQPPPSNGSNMAAVRPISEPSENTLVPPMRSHSSPNPP